MVLRKSLHFHPFIIKRKRLERVQQGGHLLYTRPTWLPSSASHGPPGPTKSDLECKALSKKLWAELGVTSKNKMNHTPEVLVMTPVTATVSAPAIFSCSLRGSWGCLLRNVRVSKTPSRILELRRKEIQKLSCDPVVWLINAIGKQTVWWFVCFDYSVI